MKDETSALATIDNSNELSHDTEVLECFARAAACVYFPKVDKFGFPSVGRFLIENGRLPYVEDEVKPWHYRGWLIPYIQMCEAHPLVSPRYDYVMRTVDAGGLLDEPIPQCNFVSEGSKEAAPGMKMLTDMIKIAEYTSGYSRSIDLVCEWLGFGLGVHNKMPDLKERDQERLYRLFDVSKWLLAPTDYIGRQMAERNVGQSAGFYPTPMSVCTMMTMMTCQERTRTELLMDCAVGTGRLLLTGSNYCLRLFGQDINWLCVLASKVNLALFAPWHLIPESFFPATPANEPIAVMETPAETPVYTTAMEQLTLF